MTTLTIPINQTSLTTLANLVNLTTLNTPDHLHHPLTNLNINNLTILTTYLLRI